MVRYKPNTHAWTPNQIVASNLARARLLRGWTQDQAAQEVAPYLGTRLSAASWSAMERSVDGGRIREFTADDLFALARGFALPLGFFLTPPYPGDGVGVAAPDAGKGGLDPKELLDVVLGTEEALAEWKTVLLTWGAQAGHRVRVTDDGRLENLGRVAPDVYDRLDHSAVLRAQMLVREQFGDLEAAHVVLRRVMNTLLVLDRVAPDAIAEHQPSAKNERDATTAPPRRSARTAKAVKSTPPPER